MNDCVRKKKKNLRESKKIMEMNAWVVKHFIFCRLFHVDTTNNKRDIKEIKILHINPSKRQLYKRIKVLQNNFLRQT